MKKWKSQCNLIYSLMIQLVLSIGFTQTMYANHAAGGELIYRWVSDSTYQFTYKFYRDCAGPAAPPAFNCCCRNSCNNALFFLALTPVAQLPDGTPNGSPLSPGCPQYPTTCTDPNSTLPGYEEWWYSGTMTLPYRCNSWTISTDIQARNFTITNIVATPALTFPADFSLYQEVTLDNLDAQGSSSPYFTIKPVPYVCLNEPYAYNNGAVDPDGDSLSFELMHSLADNSDCPPVVDSLPFANPSYNLIDNPISSNNTFQLDHATGEMSYTPDILQRAVVTLLAKKYRNGKVIGTIMRDIQTVVIPCTSAPPQFVLDTTSISGGTYANGMINTCSGNDLHFCFKVTSTANDAILVSTNNADSSIPSSQVTYAGLGTDSINVCVNWSPTLQQAGLHVVVFTVVDSACRPPGIMITRAFAIPVNVYPTIQAGPDTTICAGDHATLHAIGGNTFSWSVLSGDANSLSCANCAQPQAQPKQTTTYEVENNYFNTISCKTSDTITVNVVHIPGIDTTITKCKNDTVLLPLNMYGNNPDNYHFTWSPAIYLNNDTTANPLSWAPADLDYALTVQVSNGLVCPSADTVRIRVVNNFLHASDTGMCPGDTINIYATGGVSYHWKPDANTYISDTAIANPKISPQTDWHYIVYGENGSGCRDTATAYVKVFPAAIVQLPDSITLYYGESFQFSPETNCLTFNWFPSAGLSNDNISNPIASPQADTKYIVTGKTENECSVTNSVNVYRSNDVLLTLPNAFSPGNGPNNLLKPIYKGDVTLDYLRVFNRWGQILYESNKLDDGWDGSWHGAPQPEGVFIYTMQGHTGTGRILSKQGNITLLR